MLNFKSLFIIDTCIPYTYIDIHTYVCVSVLLYEPLKTISKVVLYCILNPPFKYLAVPQAVAAMGFFPE